jgi:hypothetical protein
LAYHHAHARCAAGPQPSRCSAHGLTPDRFIPQLRRLLAGGSRERAVYDSLVDDVVASPDPRQLFGPDHLRSGAFLVEALYHTLPERRCDDDPVPLATLLLAPLAYARWFTWRQVREEIRAGAAHCREVGVYIGRSRLDVARHLRDGWVPDPARADLDLAELLNNL